MDMQARSELARRLNSMSNEIIGAAFAVMNALGPGFLEKVYENALCHELSKRRLSTRQQSPLTVWYDGVAVGAYLADVIVEDSVLVELKCARAIDPAHVAQCINYLAATRLPLGLIINFAKNVEVKRLVGPASPWARAPTAKPESASHDPSRTQEH